MGSAESCRRNENATAGTVHVADPGEVQRADPSTVVWWHAINQDRSLFRGALDGEHIACGIGCKRSLGPRGVAAGLRNHGSIEFRDWQIVPINVGDHDAVY